MSPGSWHAYQSYVVSSNPHPLAQPDAVNAHAHHVLGPGIEGHMRPQVWVKTFLEAEEVNCLDARMMW